MQTFRRSLAAVALIGAAGFGLLAQSRPQQDYWVYFGTYTANASKGIYAYRFSPASGRLTPQGVAAETPNPSFLAVHPNGRFLYAANEHDNAIPAGKEDTVSAFAIDPATGKLRFLNKVSSRGGGPCHVSVDKTGTTLLVANYGTGSVAALPIGPDGRLGEAASVDQHQGKSVDPARQLGPHAHFIAPSPDNRFALSADLGLDQVLVYQLDPQKSRLVANAPPFAKLAPGAGPRHLAFSPAGDFVYVNGEMNSTVTVFAYDAKTGSLKPVQTISTLPSGFSGNSSTAEIQIDRAGKFLFVSNRGHDSIAIFSIDKAKGTLTAAGQVPTGGKTPRYFTLDPTGSFLFADNQASSTVSVFRMDPATAHLTAAETLNVPEPVSTVFVAVKP